MRLYCYWISNVLRIMYFLWFLHRHSELEDCRMMSEFLPLLKEVLPSAAVEIEAGIHDSMAGRGVKIYYHSSFPLE